MNRLVYWFKNRIDKEKVHCSHFCVTCKYFERCEDEISLRSFGKNKESTEVGTENEILKKAS